ncbi:DUF7715 family protein [Streptosporangium sp. CA-115845]|uniref:DUF7715 family protein n=1 Tax=Streptosporangium sp. CA-115845 TaxID=3240071 RepID=UPI003D8DCF26
MHLLVATTQTQGRRGDDFHNGEEGELVRFASLCGRDGGDPAGGCGCARSFTGFTSAKATTTALVCEVDMSRDDYVQALVSAYAFPVAGMEALVAAEADRLIALAGRLPLGAVVEVRGEEVRVRVVVDGV